MKVAVANSSEMKGVIQISSIISTIQKLCASVFFSISLFWRLWLTYKHKDGLGMPGEADLQNVCIASRKDLIARLPLRLRLRPANMI